MTTNLFVDVHIVQSMPYNSVNRDRNGMPKVAVFGGVTRGRTSGQHDRRHARDALEKALGEKAYRTRRTPQEVAKRLAERGWDQGDALLATQILIAALGIKGLGITDEGSTNTLLFLPATAFDDLADLADADRDTLTQAANAARTAMEKAKKKTAPKSGTGEDNAEDDDTPTNDSDEDSGATAILAKAAKTAKLEKTTIDAVRQILHTKNASIAAYGRMLANDPGSTTTGAVQTAHSISTHAVAPQIDFFSAVDDIVKNDGEETGAGHMGDQNYSSATYYRYSTVNMGALTTNLGGDHTTANDVLTALLHALATVVFPGKATTTAPHAPPHLVYIAIRTDRPVNLVGAFETPVPAGPQGYLRASTAALDTHNQAVTDFFGPDNHLTHAHTTLISDQQHPSLGERLTSLEQLIQHTITAIATHTK
ncbi:type I-E CRISPR-associated protein Cas7/Cse4/CasC [Streptomyces sedi]|uniref:Type I-E CRISPR-associated protein Cas7/Cse4/CasC n=1 Tax=Streptomyces sedi TaxID=555059 RepID=A0A5C4UU55_9ACTN|nr:type I-E CRISPR-associated protein Cas7/Cse4/CasC [Streptomyces sedi]TNM27065.1 hypothetical protein FH715_22180 [Streptomyces sedi]